MQRHFAGAIWTNHALERLSQRGFTQEMAGQTFANADDSIAGKQAGSIEYHKRFGKSLVTVIAKKNEKNEWLILSCWIDPPLPGTKDEKKLIAYRRFQKAGFWGKLWLEFLHQLGFGY
ncbi:MAG TPA: hypothetical protein VMR41_03280 [Patescibacteria group bacterium]|nr:hypothetical protein [Patescibacteria group bacterium]